MPSPSKPHPKSASKPPVPASHHDTFQVSPATASTGGGGGGSSQRQQPTATASDDDDSLDFVADDQPVTMIGPFEVRQTLAKNADYVTKLGYHAAQRTLHEIRIYSLKRLKGDARLRLRIEREILVMRGINHPYLLRLDDVLYSPSHLYVVTEFCQGGELYDVLASSTMDPTKLLTIPVVARILLQLVTAVAYLHTKGVAHRDVKLEHIFLDGRNTVKVGGLSSAGVSGSVPSPAAAEEHQQQQLQQQQQETWTVGPSVAAATVSGRSKAQSTDAKATKEFGDLRFTVPFGSQHYAAPEVITCGLVKRDDISDVAPPTYDGRAADVWSCGVVLFALVTGHLPFQGSTDAALFENIRNRVFAPAAVPLIVQQTKPLQDLLYGMLHVDPQQRLTTGDVLRHPFWVSVPGSRSTGMPGVETTSAGASPPRRDDGHHVPQQQQQQQSESQSALQPQQQQRTASSGRPGSHPRGVTGYAAVAAIKRDRSAPVVERRVAAANRGVAWV